MHLPIQSLSPELAAAAKRLTSDLQRAVGQNLAGLVVYGIPTAGRRRFRRPVMRVVVLLHNASEKKLAAIEPVIRSTWATIPIETTVLTPAEVTKWKEVFSTKFLEIRNRYVVLAGTAPFAAVKLSRPHVRQQIVENLRKLLLGLRRARLDMGKDESQLASSLAKIVRPFARQLTFLLQVCGHALPADDRPGVVFAAAAPLFGLDGKVLKRLTRVRRSRPTARKKFAGLYSRVLSVIARTADVTAQMKDPWEVPAREVNAGEASKVSAAAT